jgi:hypothetical protein
MALEVPAVGRETEEVQRGDPVWSEYIVYGGFMIHDVNIYTVMCGGRLETMDFVDTCGIQPSGWVPSIP